MRQRTKLKCLGCKKGFYPKGGYLKQKYCSRECAYKNRIVGCKKGKKYPHLQRARKGNCLICGKEYRATKDFKERKQKYCSKKCWAERGKKYKNLCLNCGMYYESTNNKKYCSRKCAHHHQVSEMAPAYKDGKSLQRERARNGNKLRNWRNSVFKRDNYICKICGKKGEIHAHHIEYFSSNHEKRYDINNGITLCVKCHGRQHNKDFEYRKPKSCNICKDKIKNKGNTGLCRSCGVKKSWEKRKKWGSL